MAVLVVKEYFNGPTIVSLAKSASIQDVYDTFDVHADFEKIDIDEEKYNELEEEKIYDLIDLSNSIDDFDDEDDDDEDNDEDDDDDEEYDTIGQIWITTKSVTIEEPGDVY